MKSLVKFNKKLANLVKFTLEKQKRSKNLPNEDLSGILQIAKNCLLPNSNLYTTETSAQTFFIMRET
jgi:hypothetical protein